MKITEIERLKVFFHLKNFKKHKISGKGTETKCLVLFSTKVLEYCIRKFSSCVITRNVYKCFNSFWKALSQKKVSAGFGMVIREAFSSFDTCKGTAFSKYQVSLFLLAGLKNWALLSVVCLL